jgi:hypothetical protein
MSGTDALTFHHNSPFISVHSTYEYVHDIYEVFPTIWASLHFIYTSLHLVSFYFPPSLSATFLNLIICLPYSYMTALQVLEEDRHR